MYYKCTMMFIQHHMNKLEAFQFKKYNRTYKFPIELFPISSLKYNSILTHEIGNSYTFVMDM